MENLGWPRWVMAAACVLGGVACFNNSSSENGNVDFSYDSCLLGCALTDHSLAAGGAHEGISLNRHAGVAPIASVQSSDLSIVTLTFNGSDSVDAVSGNPGIAEIQVFDANNHLLDRNTITVKATTDLVVDDGWGTAGGPTILENTPQVLHATTKNNGETLFGSGAVKFTTSGTLGPGFGLVFGDSTSFQGTKGSGNVAADCNDAHVVVPVTVIGASDLTAVSLSVATLTFDNTSAGTVDATSLAGNTPVFGAACGWTSNPPTLDISLQKGGNLSDTPAATWAIKGKPGTYDATCTIPGGKTASLAVTVH